jgi:hypothetical protein
MDPILRMHDILGHYSRGINAIIAHHTRGISGSLNCHRSRHDFLTRRLVEKLAKDWQRSNSLARKRTPP